MKNLDDFLFEKELMEYAKERFVQDNSGTLTKDQEIVLAQEFNTKYGKNIRVDDFMFDLSIHSKSRFMQRAGDLTKPNLLDFFEKVLDAVYARPRKEYLIFSQHYDRGIVIENFQSEKRIRVITILPKGSKRTMRGSNTPIIVAENIQKELNINIDNIEIIVV